MADQSIHYLKARNSEYLAGTDLEIFILEGKSRMLTVKSVEYKEDFKVNGKTKAKGLVMYFKEPYAKPLIVNTTNSKIIKDFTGEIDASKWVGLTIELYFDSKVEMKKEIVGGIRVKSVNTNGLFPALEDIETRVNRCTNIAELMSIWNGLNEGDQIKYKELLTKKRGAL